MYLLLSDSETSSEDSRSRSRTLSTPSPTGRAAVYLPHVKTYPHILGLVPFCILLLLQTLVVGPEGGVHPLSVGPVGMVHPLNRRCPARAVQENQKEKWYELQRLEEC